MIDFAVTILTAMALTAQTDTTFSVHSGARLDVNNYGGEIAVQVWGKSAVHVEAHHSPRVVVTIGQSGSNYEIRGASRRGIPSRVDYKLMVPAWMALALSGVYTDVSVQGSKGEVAVETVKGDVRLKGGDGLIKLSSVQGLVDVDGARGRLELTSVNEGVNVKDVVGEVTVEAVNGDVMLDHIQSQMVEATTVNGDVSYSGTVRDGGRYHFASHNGDLELALPDHVNATISVATFNGEFESNFPVRLVETKKGKCFSFTLGSGSALIELETFGGAIKLRRGGSLRSKEE